MPKAIDPSTWTPAERLVAASSWLGVINAVIPWWYRTRSEAATFTYNAGLTGAGAIAFACAAVTGILVLSKAWRWPSPGTKHDALLYPALAAIASTAILAQILTASGIWIGAFAGLAFAFATLVAGLMRRRERRRGWR